MVTLIGIFIFIAVIAMVVGEFGKDAEKKKQDAKDREQADLSRRIAEAAEQKSSPPSADPAR
ncbi:MAG: hypothetical protein NT025_10120 [bacterium]|nr:hypothetical protein [bacterium]